MDIPSQPIALPSTQDNDYRMGSYTGESGSFNPASYTRHFLGSPISWRPSSFGARFPSSLEKLSSSVDSDRGQLMNALAIFDREGELCRNYNCCGIHLPDLHTLLEHFERVHIVLDPHAPQPQAHIRVPFDPQCNPPMSPAPGAPVSYFPQHTQFDSAGDMELELDLDSHPQYSFAYQQPQQPPQQQQQQQQQAVSSSSPSSGAPSPPDTPISTPLSTYPSPPSHHAYLPTPTASQPPSPHHRIQHPHPHPIGVPNIPFANGLGLGYQQHHQPPVEGAFNAYARFSSDYSSCMPGTQYNPAPLTGIVDEMTIAAQQQHLQPQLQQQAQQHTIPPALLFSSSASSSRVPSPSSSSPRPGRHSSSNSHAIRSARARAAHTSPSTPTGVFTNSSALPSCSSPSTPAPSTSSALPSNASNASSNNTAPPLLLSKPFRCPKPNCNKSYKQANGLKYHVTHGSCNFAPPKDLEHVRDLLAERRRREASASNGKSSGGAAAGSQSAASAAESERDTQSPPQQEGQQYTHPSYPDLQLSESDMREVEREAERRVRPFACGVGDCTRRYKNMNGLRYHYQHSGEHGIIGMNLLAGGAHSALGVNTSVAGSTTSSTPSTPVTSDSQDGGPRRTYSSNGVRRGAAPLSRQGSLPAILASAPTSPSASGLHGQVLHTSPLHTHAMSVPVTPTDAYYSQQQQQGYGYMYAGAQQQQRHQGVGQFAYDYGFVGSDGSS